VGAGSGGSAVVPFGSQGAAFERFRGPKTNGANAPRSAKRQEPRLQKRAAIARPSALTADGAQFRVARRSVAGRVGTRARRSDGGGGPPRRRSTVDLVLNGALKRRAGGRRLRLGEKRNIPPRHRGPISMIRYSSSTDKLPARRSGLDGRRGGPRRPRCGFRPGRLVERATAGRPPPPPPAASPRLSVDYAGGRSPPRKAGARSASVREASARRRAGNGGCWQGGARKLPGDAAARAEPPWHYSREGASASRACLTQGTNASRGACTLDPRRIPGSGGRGPVFGVRNRTTDARLSLLRPDRLFRTTLARAVRISRELVTVNSLPWHERDAAGLGFTFGQRARSPRGPASSRETRVCNPGDSLFGMEAYPGREGPRSTSVLWSGERNSPA